ncbi:MAG TPA: Holliday junction branch migration protein RuvA [Trueperaceae bacterium]
MIAFVDGVVSEIREASVVVQAGPMGLELFAPKPTLVNVSKGDSVRLHTHLVVKEDLLALYGFHHRDLLELFRHLIAVGGIGPKLALAILSALPAATIASAILAGDAGLLASAPGVGKRTAERIILELGNKLPESLGSPAGSQRPQSPLTGPAEDAVEALIALGYREGQVKQAVAELALAKPEESAEGLIRRALGKLR